MKEATMKKKPRTFALGVMVQSFLREMGSISCFKIASKAQSRCWDKSFNPRNITSIPAVEQFDPALILSLISYFETASNERLLFLSNRRSIYLSIEK